ncbi:MAG: ACT domain-containing protein [Clostridium sp.]|nr:ACT domain-containing protein [Clostridium sp.]
MVLRIIKYDFSICKVKDFADINTEGEFLFVGKTDKELSVVCPTLYAPEEYLERDDGWRAFRVEGTLDFSLIGILARISSILAEHQIGIFAVSTFDTDYVLTKQVSFAKAMDVLEKEGYEIIS